jgi:hypothetical protein
MFEFEDSPFNDDVPILSPRLLRMDVLIAAVQRFGSAALQVLIAELISCEVRACTREGRGWWIALLVNTRSGESRAIRWCEIQTEAEEEVHVLNVLRACAPSAFLRAWLDMLPIDGRDCGCQEDGVSDHRRGCPLRGAYRRDTALLARAQARLARGNVAQMADAGTSHPRLSRAEAH